MCLMNYTPAPVDYLVSSSPPFRWYFFVCFWSRPEASWRGLVTRLDLRQLSESSIKAVGSTIVLRSTTW